MKVIDIKLIMKMDYLMNFQFFKFLGLLKMRRKVGGYLDDIMTNVAGSKKKL